MAGRPRKMVERVGLLEQRAFELYRDLSTLRPKQYLARKADAEGADVLTQSWNGTVEAMLEAHTSLEELLELLERRAHLPTTLCWMKRRRDRGRLIEQEVSGESAEKAGERGT